MKLAGRFMGLVVLGLMAGCTSGEALRAPATAPPSTNFGEPSDGEPATAQVYSQAAPAGAGNGPATYEAAPPPAAAAAPMAPPESSRSASRDRESRAPSERPGLGTEWGETRTSHVHDVDFVRASRSPYAAVSLRYDDGPGVEALAARHGAAASRDAREVSIARGLDLSLRDEQGAPMEMWRVGGRAYVVGHAGERYAIVLHNLTGHRFEVVATVDGLDVLDGKAGSTSKRGYIVGPYSTFEVEGFRRSEDAVAAFRFGRVGESYAARTGSARDVGVIGAAVFAENGDNFGDQEEARERDTATPFPGDARYAQPPSR